ncbi:putative unusual protein kinase [Mycobacteroides abscessus subsp. abscessus]|nr:putative unusual protein kinase [Mycobacteroides abscessus subsp. abscessus]
MKVQSKFIRMTKVLSLAFTIFLQIYWYKLRRKPESEWEKLWGKIGERFRKTLFELEGLLIKIGQILSVRSDLLPHAFIKQMEDLTDHVPPSKWEDIEKILEKEWGGSIYQHIESIGKEAIASASIGEVYQALLKNGTKVAVKVQRPNIQSIVQIDFRTLGMIIWFADHFVPVPKGFINFQMLYKELREVIERELDFAKELEALQSFSNRFSDHDTVKIPNVFPELCTKKVLVMEWVEGIKLTDVEGLKQVEFTRKEIAQKLIELFLPQWLEPGYFHADPHPGNVMISLEGKIILLDFGMVGQISKRDASYFQALIEAFLAKNYKKAVECLAQLGFLLPDADTQAMERLLSELLSFQMSELKNMDLLSLKLEMNDIIQALPIQVPTRFVFLARSVGTLEGILRNVAPEEEPLDLGKPVFMDWLRNQSNKWTFIWQWLQSQPIFKVLHSANEFLQTPQKLEQLKETEQRRKFLFITQENHKKQMFQLLLVGLMGVGFGLYVMNPFIWKIGVGISAASFVAYLGASYKQKKWMKYMPEKKRV